MTGGQEGRAVSHKEPNSPFALKVAKGSKGNQSTPICRVNRITTVPSSVEGDADGLEDRAREVDAVRRRKRRSEEEEDVLRSEASRLRVEAARLRALIGQLLD